MKVILKENGEKKVLKKGNLEEVKKYLTVIFKYDIMNYKIK